MLDFFTPVSESQSYNNFSMKEKTPVAKINLRGSLENKEFASKIGKILGMILPKETCGTSSKEKITSLWLGPNEWLLVSNEEIPKDTNVKYEYEADFEAFKYDRSLLTAMTYPSSYGFIPNTLADDGDALDIFVYLIVLKLCIILSST